MNSLKKSLSVALLALLVGTPAIMISAGCSSTNTRESTGEYVDDSAITAKVKAALIHDEVVKAGDVNVETFKGVVQLSGFVNSSEQKARAGRIAAGIAGVRDVQNRLTVK